MARAIAGLLFPVLSIAALENFYTEAPVGSGATGEDVPPLPLTTPSQVWSSRGPETDRSVVKQVDQLAISWLRVDTAPVGAAPSSVFHARPTAISLQGLPSEPYSNGSQRC